MKDRDFRCTMVRTKKTNLVWWTVLLAGTIPFTSCSREFPSQRRPLMERIVSMVDGNVPQRPAEVVEQFYRLANDGRYADAMVMTSAPLQTAFAGNPTSAISAMDLATGKQTITRYEFVSSGIGGRNEGSVRVRLFYRDGTMQLKRHALVPEGATWRISDL